MLRTICMAAVLAVFWLAFSGMFEGLLLSLGALSCALVLWLVARADAADRQRVSLEIYWFGWAAYSVWLVKEIAVANADVVKRIFGGKRAIDPRLVRLKLSQKTEIGRVVYANSITLTPGTVSVDLDDESVTVHALSAEGIESLEGGEMDRRVRRIEKVR